MCCGMAPFLLLAIFLAQAWADMTCEAQERQLGIVSRQLMLQQLFVEERIRSEGNSGVKQVRLNSAGTRPYHAPTHSASGRVASMHDHANYNNTVGLGELIVVMNGVEFRTRHNDYKLKMAHTSSSDYEATEDIPFPDVPKEVTDKNTLEEQVQELREWFKAWRDQDHSVRDYRPYFKANLCYMEGAWTTSVDDIQESFDSDRHSLDATSWLDLQDKVRFTSYSGAKSQLENFAYLPTTIMNMINGSIPQLAQWNYRILCHPIARDIPLNRFRVIDEVATRMRRKMTYEQLGAKRDARFQLNPKDEDTFVDGIEKLGLLDELMYEIPGKDNGGAHLIDDLDGLSMFTYDSSPSEDLNAANYHRWYRADAKDAMGIDARHRGYSDDTLFMAMTTQPQVAGMKLEVCKKKDCWTVKQKWSYAIPLEIIYLSPLSKWNPHNVEYKGHFKTDLGKTVTANQRNGGQTTETAFDGVNNEYYYITPFEFYNGSPEEGVDPADTTRSSAGVLDTEGNMQLMSAAGIRAHFPNIPGVGILRQRYPIMPVHGEGSSVWKELEALKDIVLNPVSNGYLFREPPGRDGSSTGDGSELIVTMITRPSSAETGLHTHLINLLASDVAALQGGQTTAFTTTQTNGHSHRMVIEYTAPTDSEKGYFSYVQCDDKSPGKRCFDSHPFKLNTVTL